MKIAILGLGPAGIFALALLPEQALKDAVVFEPAAIGGDLATKYAAVIANIPKSQIVAAFKKIPRYESTAFPFLDPYSDDACPPLGVVAKQLRQLALPLLKQTTFHASKVTHLEYKADIWTLKTQTNELFEVQKVFVCTGAEPKAMNLPLPTIPLYVALTPALLSAHVNSEDNVVVFGTAHSGTLVLKNLKDACVSKVTAVHKGPTPFIYARDGVSEGIKAESATIADSIKAGEWTNQTPTFLSYDKFADVYRAVYSATAVIYACGFERSSVTITNNGVEQKVSHDGTGFVDAPPGLYGFGIGFPSLYTGSDGKKYPDIGFAGFIDALLPVIQQLDV